MTQFYWLQLNGELRARIAKEFDLVRSSGATVENMNGKMRVVSDGYSENDLAALTIKKMQKFTKSKEEDFWKLFKETKACLDEIMAKEHELERQKIALEEEKQKA